MINKINDSILKIATIINKYCEKILSMKVQIFTFMLWEFTILSLSESYGVV